MLLVHARRALVERALTQGGWGVRSAQVRGNLPEGPKMHIPTRPALIVATLALGGLFPVAGVLAHQAHPEWPQPPAPPAPPVPPESPGMPEPPALPEPPAPPEVEQRDIGRIVEDSHREALAAIREARRDVEQERNMPRDVRARVLAELDAAVARVERDFRRPRD